MINYNVNGLKSSDYEHSADKVALETLRKIPLLNTIMAAFLDFTTKSSLYMEVSGDYFRVTEATCPRVYKLFQLALDRLNMDKEPELFIKPDYNFNAFAAGAKENFIVINSSCVENFTDEELLMDLGHELGHIKSGHMLYYSLANNINSLIGAFGGMSALLSTGLGYALMDWQRKSEFTADRAGMIAAMNYEQVQSNMIKYMGHGSAKDVDFSIDNVMEQYKDFDLAKESVIGKLLYAGLTLGMSHPWSVLRIKELSDWNNSGDYKDLITKYNIE